MIYCSKCGQKLNDDAMFCSKCGNKVGKEIQKDSNSKRKIIYDGRIHKCPNCGSQLKSFEHKCEYCGYELIGSDFSSTVKEFALKLEKTKSIDKKMELISNFYIPNTKEDINEFFILAISNINSDAECRDAWRAKLEQTYHKAKLSFKQGKKETNKKYYWISKSLKKNVNSIDDLIDLAHITADAKANMKAWVKKCNYMSYPTLYSNDKILAPFNGAFIFELYYVFEILIEMMGTFYEIIKAIESIDQFNSSFDIKLIENTIPRFFIFQDDFNQFDRTPKEIVSDFSPIDYNQNPYNIRAEYTMLNIGITAPHIKNGFGERKRL